MHKLVALENATITVKQNGAILQHLQVAGLLGYLVILHKLKKQGDEGLTIKPRGYRTRVRANALRTRF